MSNCADRAKCANGRNQTAKAPSECEKPRRITEIQPAERACPGLAADVVDDHLHAAVAEHAGLAEEAVHGFDELLP